MTKQTKRGGGNNMKPLRGRGQNVGKSKCCKAEVNYEGGGYDGEDIVPIVINCTGCGKINPDIIRSVGRPVNLPF